MAVNSTEFLEMKEELCSKMITDLNNKLGHFVDKYEVKDVNMSYWDKYNAKRLYINIKFKKFTYTLYIELDQKNPILINIILEKMSRRYPHPKVRYVVLKYIEDNIEEIIETFIGEKIKKNEVFNIEDRKILIFKQRFILVNYDYKGKSWKEQKYI